MVEFQLTHSDPVVGPKDLATDDAGRDHQLVVHSGRKIDLEIKEWNRLWGTPKIKNSDPTALEVSNPKLKAGLWVITVQAKTVGMGGVAVITATDSAGTERTKPVDVYAGHFNHTPEFPTDLIADVFRKGRPDQMQGVIRMLHSHSKTLVNQKSTYNKQQWGHDRACGTVCKVAGQKFINIKTDYEDAKKTGGHIHNRISKSGPIDRKDIQYPAGAITKMANAIQKNLKAGMPVLVHVVDDPPSTTLEGGKIKHTGLGAHSLLIVGCKDNAKEFLFIDPWPGGSKYTYDGRIGGFMTFGVECRHLGVLEVAPAPEADRSFDIMKARLDTQDAHNGPLYYEVIFGPY